MEVERDKKEPHTHLVPKKEGSRVVDEGAKSWTPFYSGPKLTRSITSSSDYFLTNSS